MFSIDYPAVSTPGPKSTHGFQPTTAPYPVSIKIMIQLSLSLVPPAQQPWGYVHLTFSSPKHYFLRAGERSFAPSPWLSLLLEQLILIHPVLEARCPAAFLSASLLYGPVRLFLFTSNIIFPQ